MSPEPEVIERAEPPCVAVKGQVTMQTISAIAARIPKVFGWLGARGHPARATTGAGRSRGTSPGS